MSEHPTAGEQRATAVPPQEGAYPQAPGEGAIPNVDSFEQAPHDEVPQKSTKIAWDAILVWSVVVAAVAIVGVLTVFLVLGLLELIAVVSPVLLAILLAWVGYLTFRLVRLEKNLAVGSK